MRLLIIIPVTLLLSACITSRSDTEENGKLNENEVVRETKTINHPDGTQTIEVTERSRYMEATSQRALQTNTTTTAPGVQKTAGFLANMSGNPLVSLAAGALLGGGGTAGYQRARNSVPKWMNQQPHYPQFPPQPAPTPPVQPPNHAAPPPRRDEQQ